MLTSIRARASYIALAASSFLSTQTALAQFETNPGGTLTLGTDIRGTVTDVIQGVLNFLALIAVIVIIIAGIRMVVSSGDEQAVDKAKKTILWAVIGLIVILLAGAIVDFVVQLTN